MSKRETLKKMAKVPIKVAKYAKKETEREVKKLVKGKDHKEVKRVAKKMVAETKKYTTAMRKILMAEMKKAAKVGAKRVKKKAKKAKRKVKRKVKKKKR
ncbi:hypothetical protein KY338_00655 [Candidatus Woesearchaeota archaeon]|nr:hypothetical protein [Candidatus Woesearchaeota archaeon]MBW3005170.1 hypothetical protein [Candidatus Woesearchaeota archaeon]